MRQIVAIASCLVASLAFSQEGIKFENTNYKTLLQKAKTENKLVFIDAYASWCGPCKLMAKNVFTQKEVGDYYNANFINAKIDMEKGEGKDLAKKYSVKSYPTYLWLNSDGELVHTSVGYYEADDFLKIGKDANDPSKQVVFLKKKFDAGEKDPEILKNYYMAIAYRDAEEANKVATRYFAQRTATDTYSREDAMMLLNSIGTIEEDLYKIYLRDKENLAKAFPMVNLDNFEKGVKLSSAKKKAYNTDTKKLNEIVFLQEAKKYFTEEEANRELNSFKLLLVRSKKDYATYEKLALETFKNPADFSANELNSAAWTFFENVTNKASLQKAIEWSHESVKKNENFAYTDTLAHLYSKVGDKKNATLWATKSIELGKASGEDTTDTEKLLKSLK